MHKQSNGIIWALALVFGLGTGVLWLVLSALLYNSAAQGFANGRSDWGAGWGLVATLLLAAGLSAIIGTLWHRRISRKHT